MWCAQSLSACARDEKRRGVVERVRYEVGDFVALAGETEPADLVILDRVVCCYPLYQPLIEEAMRHAERYFAFSYPRDVWYVHVAIAFENAIRRIRTNPFRAFVHPVEGMTHVMGTIDLDVARDRAGFGSCRMSSRWSI